jgi:glycosyltransferase involved in cell wall biosynthesis
MKVAAVIPVWEEEGSIGPVVSAIPRALVCDVFVVDGGSRDRTQAVAQAAGAEVVVQRRRGYGAACFEGAAAARAAGADVVVFLDGDGTDRPEAMGGLLAPILAGTHDFVIGSRTRGQREAGAMGAHQLLAGRALGAAIGLLYGVRYTDMAAFRAIRLDALERLRMREMTYGWNLEMQMRAARAKLRILEIPVPAARRTAGRSKVAGTLRGTLKASWRIMTTFCRIAAAG